MSKPLKIALLGATGAVGAQFLKLVLGAEYKVQALVRDPSKLDEQDGLTIFKGDVTQSKDVAAIVADVDVVVSCVGNAKNTYVMEPAARSILEAARSQETPPKCIVISSLGCNGSSWPIKMISIVLGGRKTFADYDRADALILKESTVPYVLVRPTGLTDKPGSGKYTAVRTGGTFSKLIARADVAKFLFDATTESTWDGPGAVHLGGFSGAGKSAD